MVRATASSDPHEARVLRDELVSTIENLGGVRDPRVLAAMQAVPRHLFVPDASLDDAYGDWPLPIGAGQTISQPTIVAVMTEALEPAPSDRVLEIGTGSGYQAAVLARLVDRVYSIEVVPALAREAAARLERLGYANVRVCAGDGYAGWPEAAPFDKIILTAAPPEVPQVLLEQLADGGVLVAPIGDDWQSLVRIRKNGDSLTRETLESVRFVPMVRGR